MTSKTNFLCINSMNPHYSYGLRSKVLLCFRYRICKLRIFASSSARAHGRVEEFRTALRNNVSNNVVVLSECQQLVNI